MAKAFRRFGLASSSQAPVDVVKTNVAPTLSSADAKKFGLENFGNNCYANSVIQALYFCTPFRDLMLQSPDASLPSHAPHSPITTPTPVTPLAPVRRKPERKYSTASAPEPILPPAVPIPSSPPSLFSALRSLFLYISTHPQERGTVSPRAFIEKLKELNRVFDNTTHQDAHEFLNYLLNKIVEEVEEERKDLEAHEDLSNSVTTFHSQVPSSGHSTQHNTLVHRLFEGVLTSETRCLTCETVSSRDESFLDLSIDIEQNSSVTACLRQFSASEMLCHKNKFFCDSCCDLQEAEKRMKIKRLPNILALHLKRFKYQEESQRYVKLAYRVAFPFELRLFNTVDEMDDADRLYNLFGIVVHIGNGPHHGHYVSIIKTLGTWLIFDDENVSPIAESEISKYFGDAAPAAGCAYVLYYQAANIDMGKLGLRPEQTEEFRNTAVAELSQPMRPPGLAPEDVASIPTPSESTSSSELNPLPSIPPPTPPSLPPTQPIPVTNPSAASLRTSISASTSSSHSHSQTRSSIRQLPPSMPPPPAPPLTSSLSSPSPAKPTASSIFNKAIHRSPSISIDTGGDHNSTATAGSSTTTPTTGIYQVSPMPLTPTRLLVNGAEPESPTTTSTRTSRQQPKLGVRPTTVHGHAGSAPPRALPVPPRPQTSGDPDGEREREKEKESGWGKKWFSGVGGRNTEPSGAVDGEVLGNGGNVEGNGSALGDAEPYLNGSANGGAVTGSKKKEKENKEKDREKEKEKGKTWFTKRKSFRIGGEKSSKSSAAASTLDVEPAADSSVWFRPSLQIPQRRASESTEGQAPAPPPMAAVRSTPGLYAHGPPSGSGSNYRPRPPSTNLRTERPNSLLHPQDYVLANGEISPTPSSTTSSIESVGQIIAAPSSVVPPVLPSPHRRSTSHQPPPQHPTRAHQIHNVSNGHPPPSHPIPPPPAPRVQSSVSTPAGPPSASLPGTPISPQSRTRTLPTVPHSPNTPLTPERKKSLANLPAFRSRDKEKEKDATVPPPRPSTAGAEVGRDRERPLPSLPVSPPVPVPANDIAELRTHQYYHHQQPHTQHQRHGSVFGGPEVEVPVDGAPGLSAFGSGNTSVASSGSNGGNGFKRATRKLSLTAPMLGFGKRDKDRDKSKEKEKAAPTSFTHV
ncbi:hypothetical protein C0991_007627 [Blastosporella zonata]|nr:hypothetical protein C0991_007627 [Blastosporella zonata]